MNNFTSYNHAASQGLKKTTRIKGRGTFVQPEAIPQFPQQTSALLEAEVMNLSKALNDVPTLQRLLSSFTQQVLDLEDKVREDAEKVTFYDEVAETGHLFDIDEAAKIVGTGRTRLLEYLRKHRVLMGSSHRFNRPYQKYIKAGKFEVKYLHYKNRNTGKLKLKSMPFLTGKGLIWLQQFIDKHGRYGL